MASKKRQRRATEIHRARVRQTQSCPCPECGRDSRVLRTTKIEKAVVRRRKCVSGHVFTTEEKPK